MNIAWWLLFFAVTWSSIGLIVALLLGRILRNANSIPEEVTDRLIC